MKKYQAISLMIICLLAALSLTGCTTWNNFREGFIDSPEDAPDTINIGVYEPMAGADKDDAKAELAGIELAHEQYPEVEGRQINLIYADNNSDIDAAETAITTLLSKKPSVILGSYGNIYSLLAGEYIEEAKVPSIAITNTNPLITQNNSYYFRVCYIDATQGRLLARYLDVNDVKEAGILIPEKDDAAMAMATAFSDSLKSLTGDDDAIAVYERYTTGDTDFKDVLKAVKKSKVKYVLLPGETPDAVNIIQQANEMKLDVTFLGDMSWGSEDFRDTLGDQISQDHLAFVQFFATDGTDKKQSVGETREAFLSAWRKLHGDGQEPEEAVALGYDAYLIAVDAVLKSEDSSGQTSGEAIRDILRDDNYLFEGASGTIRFNASGDPKKTAYISTWEDNAVKAVYTIEASEQ